jgi:hypothetical protein
MPNIMSIGNFHWYIDHIDETDAEKLSQREDIFHIHKDQPVFHITEQVQKKSPSWVSFFFISIECILNFFNNKMKGP